MTPYLPNVVDLATKLSGPRVRWRTFDRRASRPRRITGFVLACSSSLILPGPARALGAPPAADTDDAIEVAAPGPAEASEQPPMETAAPPMPADPAAPIPGPPPVDPSPQPPPENTGELPPATTPIQPSADLPPPSAGAPPPSETKPNPPGTGLIIAGAVMLAPTAGLLVFGGLGKLWNANCNLICGDGSVSTGLLVAGGVIGVASVSMLITGIVTRDNHRAQLVVAPVTGPRMVGVGLAGQF